MGEGIHILTAARQQILRMVSQDDGGRGGTAVGKDAAAVGV